MYDYLLIKLDFDLPDFCHYTIFTGAILVCSYFVAITYVVMLHFTDFVIVLVYVQRGTGALLLFKECLLSFLLKPTVF